MHGSGPWPRHYSDALPVLVRFAELLATMAPTITRIRCVQTITRLLKDPPPELDWPSGEVARLARNYSALFVRTQWSDEVEARLAEPDGEFGFNRYTHRYHPARILIDELHEAAAPYRSTSETGFHHGHQ
ncbi:hypothetical protein ACLMAL_23895 [Nocardia sp. CWNU-33]|uniref:hypothetical protein n=1 Tax=Nocardia sp. CWNU-33 TaxID=3392117 RepID=UPI00398F3560